MTPPESAVGTSQPERIRRAELAGPRRRFPRMHGPSWPLGLLAIASLLLLSGCGMLDPHKVKMYQGAPLPESEVSVLRGAYSTKPQSNNVEEVTCWASACTFAIDGATPHGKGGDGYSDYGWSHPPEPQEVEWGAGDYDFYLVPGVHTIGASTSYFLADNRKGLEGLRTKHLFAHGRLQYDFQKGDRYQIAVRIAGFRRLAGRRVLCAISLWLQRVNPDGSVQDAAQFETIKRQRPKEDSGPGILF